LHLTIFDEQKITPMKKQNFILPFFFLFIACQLIGQNNRNILLLNIGGSVWGEDDLNSTKNPGERGGSRVWVNLLNTQTMKLDSVMTDNDGNYLFEDKLSGFYQIILPEKNFMSGGPLYGLRTCDGQENDIITDNDDNGDGGWSSVSTTILDLTYPGSSQSDLTNTTFDFCINSNCGTPNALASGSQNDISDTICDLSILEILCSRMRKEQNNANIKLCSSGLSAYNMDWFRFVAGAGNYELEINLFGCIGGLNGAQVGVYDKNNVAVFCNEDGCKTGKQIISSSLLIPGETYSLWINGCEGSVCSYEINLIGNFIQYQVPEITGIETSADPGSVCLGDTVFFSPFVIENKGYKFRWKIKKPNNNTESITSNDLPFKYAFIETGTYDVELTDINAKCSLPINPISLRVNVVKTEACDKLIVYVKKVVGPDCKKSGFILANILNTNGIPIKVYLDDTLVAIQDTYYINYGGFHKIRVTDSFGYSNESTFLMPPNINKDSFDLTAHLNASNFVRGFESNATIKASNFSCKKINASVLLFIPSEIEFVSSAPIPTFNDGSGKIKWDFAQMIGVKTISLVFKTKPEAVIGNTFVINTKTAPLTDDANPANNDKIYTFTVLGAFDPNDIINQPYGKCSPRYTSRTSPINYTIRFQNTGNFPAKDVYLLDSISEYLDISTVNVLSSSHNVVTHLLKNKVLRFDFPDIQLPFSTQDEKGSNGFVTFDIMLKDSTPMNTVVQNQAAIYFDFNEPIFTNTVFNTIVDNIPLYTFTQNIEICNGDSILIGGSYFNKDSSFVSTYFAKDLCDSLVTYQVVVKAPLDVPIFNNQQYVSTKNEFDTYTWKDCTDDSIEFSNNSALFYPPRNGTYKVKVTKNGCSQWSECISFTTATNDLKDLHTMSVFPNPTIDGSINVELTESSDEVMNVSAANTLGQSIKINAKALSKLHWLISELEKGVYFLNVKTNHSIYRRKVVVE
jgi:hypothetical protein